MKTSIKLLFMLSLALFLAGCVVCELRVTNHTGGAIQFYTDHTKRTVRIPDGATRTIPHAAGQIRISTEQAEVWEYDAVNVPELTTETKKGFQRVTLPLTVGSNGIVVLPSGKRLQPSRRIYGNVKIDG